MTPTNGARLSDDIWLAKVEQLIKDEHAWAREQIEGEEQEREKQADGFITRHEFESYKEVIKTRYSNVVRIVDGLVWCVLLAVVAAIVALIIPGIQGVKH